jgi:hypothetical protein
MCLMLYMATQMDLSVRSAPELSVEEVEPSRESAYAREILLPRAVLLPRATWKMTGGVTRLAASLLLLSPARTGRKKGSIGRNQRAKKGYQSRTKRARRDEAGHTR